MKPIFRLRNSTPKVICLFRHPVKRIMSSIRFHQAPKRRYNGMSIDAIIEQFGESEETTQASNLGHIKRENNLNQILDSLEQISAIGITDRFKESIRYINDKFSWNLTTIKTLNKSNRQTSFSQQQLDSIQELAQMDMIIYQQALNLFEQRIKTLN